MNKNDNFFDFRRRNMSAKEEHLARQDEGLANREENLSHEQEKPAKQDDNKLAENIEDGKQEKQEDKADEPKEEEKVSIEFENINTMDTSYDVSLKILDELANIYKNNR